MSSRTGGSGTNQPRSCAMRVSADQQFRCRTKSIYKVCGFTWIISPPSEHFRHSKWIEPNGNQRSRLCVCHGLIPLRHRCFTCGGEKTFERFFISLARCKQSSADDLVRWCPRQHRIAECVTMRHQDCAIKEIDKVQLRGVVIVIAIDARHRNAAARSKIQSRIEQFQRLFAVMNVVNISGITIQNDTIARLKKGGECFWRSRRSTAGNIGQSKVQIR